MLLECCNFEFIVISSTSILDNHRQTYWRKKTPNTPNHQKSPEMPFLKFTKTQKDPQANRKQNTSQHIWNGSSCTGILNSRFALSLHSEKTKDSRAISGHAHLSTKELNSEVTTARKLGCIIIELQFSTLPLNLGFNLCLQNMQNLLKTNLFSL